MSDTRFYSNGMYVNTTNLKAIIVQLREKIDSIKRCYDDMNNIVKDIDGSNDNWKGKNQQKFNNIYTIISSEYPEDVQKLEEFYSFLCKIVSDYEQRENDINKDIDNNEQNLDIN